MGQLSNTNVIPAFPVIPVPRAFIGTIHLKMKIRPSFTQPYAIPNMYNVHFSMADILKFNSQALELI